MKKKIYYLAHYDENLITRNVSPAAKAKTDYILNQISVDKYDIELISLANVKLGKKEKGQTKQSTKHENVTIKTFSSRSQKIRLFRILFLLIMQIKFFLYTLFKLKRNDTVIVYHSSLLMIHAKLLKFFKNIDIIYQIEEIYGYVNNNERMIKKEIEAFKMTNKYILSTEELTKHLKKDSNYIVINGPIDLKKYKQKDHSPVYKCVYAGTFSKEKKGAYNAIDAFKYLDHNFELHIMGFGSVDEVNEIKEKISKFNKDNKSKIIYHGLKFNEEFDYIINQCSIGLATQTTDGEYNLYSFPSKVLSYLSYGLDVVSSDINVVRNSSVSDLIHYYVDDSPYHISRTIEKASKNRKNSFERLEEINKEISYNLGIFLGKGEKHG